MLNQNEFNLFLKHFPAMAGGIYDLFIKTNLSYNKLKNFLADDISEELDSLKTNLKIFLFVRSQHAGHSDLQKEELLNLLENFETIGLNPNILETLYGLKALVVGGSNALIESPELDNFFHITKEI